VEFDNVLSVYLCDIYADYVASSLAPMSFLRASMSGTFPLFANSMFGKLGPNNALFVLAVLATLFCGFAVLLRFYGETARRRSKYAKGTPA
jgi:hypothetical protein